MNLSDLKVFEAWFKERVGISYEEAEAHPGFKNVRAVKAAYAAGMTRGTMETLKLMCVPFTQIGWRWRYRDGQYSAVFPGNGPTAHALASANSLMTFAPVAWEPVYCRSSETSR